jgi:hypothetical protein
LHLARLIADGQISILSTSDEIEKHIQGYKREEIGEALCSLIEDNEMSEMIDVEEDFYDGY